MQDSLSLTTKQSMIKLFVLILWLRMFCEIDSVL